MAPPLQASRWMLTSEYPCCSAGRSVTKHLLINALASPHHPPPVVTDSKQTQYLVPDDAKYLTQSQQEPVLLDSVPYGQQGPWAMNIWAKLGDQWGQDLQVWDRRTAEKYFLYIYIIILEKSFF